MKSVLSATELTTTAPVVWQSLRQGPARPRRKRRRPSYPRAVGAGLLVVATACGSEPTREDELGGSAPGSFQACPSEPPAPNDDCDGWTVCSYELTHQCDYGNYVVETQLTCDNGKVKKTHPDGPDCPAMPGGAAIEPWDCPADKPAEGEPCGDLYPPICAYETLIRCPDGQPETIVVEYSCTANTWGCRSTC